MEKFEITGGKRLGGNVRNQGCKNAALPILVASLLTDEEVILRNVPHVIDVRNMAEVLRATGEVREGSDIRINASSITRARLFRNSC